MINYFLIFFQSVINVAAQLLLKKGVGSLNFSLKPVDLIISMVTNINIFGGVSIFVVSLLLWLYLLSKFELSFIYPIGSLSYVLAAVGGYVFFGESITVYRVLGIAFILVGVFLVAKS